MTGKNHDAILEHLRGTFADEDTIANGAPKVTVLEGLLGYQITAEERDEAWETYQGQLDAQDEPAAQDNPAGEDKARMAMDQSARDAEEARHDHDTNLQIDEPITPSNPSLAGSDTDQTEDPGITNVAPLMGTDTVGVGGAGPIAKAADFRPTELTTGYRNANEDGTELKQDEEGNGGAVSKLERQGDEPDADHERAEKAPSPSRAPDYDPRELVANVSTDDADQPADEPEGEKVPEEEMPSDAPDYSRVELVANVNGDESERRGSAQPEGKRVMIGDLSVTALPIYVHGVGRTTVYPNKEATLNDETIEVLRNSGVSVREIQ